MYLLDILLTYKLGDVPLSAVVVPDFWHTELCKDGKLCHRRIGEVNLNHHIRRWVDCQVEFSFASEACDALHVKTRIGLEPALQVFAAEAPSEVIVAERGQSCIELTPSAACSGPQGASGLASQHTRAPRGPPLTEASRTCPPTLANSSWMWRISVGELVLRSK